MAEVKSPADKSRLSENELEQLYQRMIHHGRLHTAACDIAVVVVTARELELMLDEIHDGRRK